MITCLRTAPNYLAYSHATQKTRNEKVETNVTNEHDVMIKTPNWQEDKQSAI